MAANEGYFNELIGWAETRLSGGEVLLSSVSGEDTDFIRLNHGLIRQAGSTRQATVSLDLIEGARHTEGSVVLSGDRSMDEGRVGNLLDTLREQRAVVQDDPYLLYNTEPTSSSFVGTNELPGADEALGSIRSAAADQDLVGIYASGVTYAGFASSLGQRNWHQTATFNLDWSFYLRADKAAKNSYAGFAWDDAAFGAKVDWSRQQLAVLGREPVTIDPGGYRTYLAPAALLELIDLWSWGGFSEKSHRTKQTPLLKMVTEGATLAPGVQVCEATAGGVAPNFQEAGFVRPDEVVLIEDGMFRRTLVSPRTAQEYGIEANGASPWEEPQSLAVGAGSLDATTAVEQLGTGLFVGNLWYTNFSDRAACRTTGMTRFATFWAEDGEVVAPVNVMRFDDTIYNLLGDRLIDLTDDPEVILDAGTCTERSTASFRVPGALVEEMLFTL